VAKAEKARSEPGVVTRLAERGEEAMSRLADELGKNQVLSDALHRMASAKGKVDAASRSAFAQLGLASADEVEKLRKKVAALEKRLAALEGPKKAAARRSAPKRPTSRTGP